MRAKFLIISSALTIYCVKAQNTTASLTTTEVTVTTPVPEASMTSSVAAEAGSQVAIMDYKSVYEAATVEEEIKMATERFSLTPAQQDIWLSAANDRRMVEKQAKEKLNSNMPNYEKDGVYRGLRTAHNTFHTTIIGYMNPHQKQALELDRAILDEKQKRIAKLPPPPPPAPTVTVAPIDSVAIKEAEKAKTGGKKSKKKKKG